MKTGEILAQHTFLKVAISDELKARVQWERSARRSLTDYSTESMKKMNLTNPQYNPTKLYTDAGYKYQPIKNDTRSGITLPHEVRAKDMYLANSTAPSLGMSLSDHISGVKAQKAINKAKNIKTLGKGALIGAGVLGGGMLANHLLKPSKPKPLTKEASNLVNALELGGLGVLAAPSVAGLAGHPMGEKAKEIAEVGGLGVLAAHPTYELGHAAVNAVKGLPAQGTGLLQRAGQSIGQGINKLRPMIPAMSKLAYTAFYQEVLKK
jgi:hypothetical protein